jgi:hypothetical protein
MDRQAAASLNVGRPFLGAVSTTHPESQVIYQVLHIRSPHRFDDTISHRQRVPFYRCPSSLPLRSVDNSVVLRWSLDRRSSAPDSSGTAYFIVLGTIAVKGRARRTNENPGPQ